MTINLNKNNATNFQLVFPLLPTNILYEKSKEFTLNVYGSVVPSVSLEQQVKEWQGSKSFTDSGELNFGQLMVDFVVDSIFSNWKTLFDWINLIHNNYDSPGYMQEKGLSIDASLLIYSNFRQKVLSLHFENIWPLELGEVVMNKRDGQEDLVSNVVFVYDSYKVV